MARKPEQHRIDDAAKRCFHKIFDDVSIANELVPDYGIDFRLQMLDGDTMTSSVFLVQLKGHRRFSKTIRDGKTFICQRLSSQRLADYFDIHHEPVFLFVVDTFTNEARYLFMQGYSDSPLLPKDWKKSNEVTVYVPDVNDPCAMTPFRHDLDNALAFMNNKYPGTPEAAIRAATEKYRKLDPRFEVKWTFGDGKPFPAFMPIADVQLNMKITTKGADAGLRIQRLFDSGLPTQFSPDEITFSGSPLYERELPKLPMMLQMGVKHKIQLSVIRAGADGADKSRLDGFVGEMISGRKCCHFRAGLPNDLIVVSTDDMPYENKNHPISISIKIDSLFKAPVLDIPHFDQMLTVFVEHEDLPFALKILFPETGHILPFPLATLSHEALANTRGTLRLIAKLRAIAKELRINPRIRSDLTDGFINDIHRVHTLLFKGKTEKPLGAGVITISMNRENAQKILAMPTLDNITMTLGERIEFFEPSVDIGDCIRSFNHLYVRNRSVVEELIQTGTSEEISITLEGREGSTVTDTIKINMAQPKIE